MEVSELVWSLVQAGVMPSILLGLAIWNSDKALSEEGTQVVYSYIHGTSENPSKSKVAKEIELFLGRYFSLDNGIFNFSFNVLILTCISLFLFLCIYTSRTEGFYSYLMTSGFLSQFLGNGFVVTYLTNFFIFSTYSMLLGRFISAGLGVSLLMIFIDQLSKLTLFLLLTTITYIWFADFGGAFSGDKILAIKAIPETVMLALKFENLTSVYIYSLLLSSFPLFIVLIIKIMAGNEKANMLFRSILFWLPFKNKPLRFLGCLFSVFCAIFASVTSIVLSPLTS
ncbi:hypothetical protein AB6T38_15455 [Aliiglaciecola sp. SL4]|uniref:hypothetical protein n=1 Tax=Aliiglaciecola sp. SL4 TaxID=3239806 RepID=UPI00355AF284